MSPQLSRFYNSPHLSSDQNQISPHLPCIGIWNFSTWQIFLHMSHMWTLWQIWGMLESKGHPWSLLSSCIEHDLLGSSALKDREEPSALNKLKEGWVGWLILVYSFKMQSAITVTRPPRWPQVVGVRLHPTSPPLPPQLNANSSLPTSSFSKLQQDQWSKGHITQLIFVFCLPIGNWYDIKDRHSMPLPKWVRAVIFLLVSHISAPESNHSFNSQGLFERNIDKIYRWSS